MIEMFLRLLIILSCLASCIYGILTIQRNFRPSFYKIAVCGMFAFFLSRLFYFVLTLSSGDDSAFSVGVLGQSTAYIFYIIANQAYVPKEEEEVAGYSFCIAAFAVAIVPCVLMAAAAVIDGSLGAYIGEGIYLVTMGPAAYYAMKGVINQHDNPFRKQITPFNICVCILIYINSLSEIVTVMDIEAILNISRYVLTFIAVPVILAMIPLLRRGLSPWEL